VNNPKSLLSEVGLKKAIEDTSSAEAKKELSIAFKWSRRVDQAVADIINKLFPFQYDWYIYPTSWQCRNIFCLHPGNLS